MSYCISSHTSQTCYVCTAATSQVPHFSARGLTLLHRDSQLIPFAVPAEHTDNFASHHVAPAAKALLVSTSLITDCSLTTCGESGIYNIYYSYTLSCYVAGLLYRYLICQVYIYT